MTAPTAPKRGKPGRPPREGPRVQYALACESEEQRARWYEAADREGVQLASKARELLDRWARRALADGTKKAPAGP